METKLLTKIHGYKNHQVSNFCQDRYPYIENKQKEIEDCKGVFRSSYPRIYQNLYNILKNTNSNNIEKREALLILNEMSNHQETKVDLIQNNFVELCMDYTQYKQNDIIYENIRLLGSLISIKLGRDRLKPYLLKELQYIALNDDFKIREVFSWFLCRLVSGRDGVHFLQKNGFIQVLIKSYMKFSQPLQQNNYEFMSKLLLCFVEVLQEDEAIIKFTGNNVFQRMLENILQLHEKKDQFQIYELTLIKRILNCMGCFTMNIDGKEEGVELQVNEKLSIFLDYEDLDVVNYTVRIFMFLSIDLEGKIQIIRQKNDKIIKQLINVLNKDLNIQQNCYEVFKNIAENQQGFKIIAKFLSKKVNEILNIFDKKCIIPLDQLLKDCCQIQKIQNQEQVDEIIQYMTPIIEYLERKKDDEENYDNALGYIIENTNDFVSTIFPQLLFCENEEFQNEIYELIVNMIIKDKKNEILLKNSYNKLKQIKIKIYETTLEEQIKHYPELLKILSIEEQLIYQNSLIICYLNYFFKIQWLKNLLIENFLKLFKMLEKLFKLLKLLMIKFLFVYINNQVSQIQDHYQLILNFYILKVVQLLKKLLKKVLLLLHYFQYIILLIIYYKKIYLKTNFKIYFNLLINLKNYYLLD